MCKLFNKAKENRFQDVLKSFADAANELCNCEVLFSHDHISLFILFLKAVPPVLTFATTVIILLKKELSNKHTSKNKDANRPDVKHQKDKLDSFDYHI